MKQSIRIQFLVALATVLVVTFFLSRCSNAKRDSLFESLESIADISRTQMKSTQRETAKLHEKSTEYTQNPTLDKLKSLRQTWKTAFKAIKKIEWNRTGEGPYLNYYKDLESWSDEIYLCTSREEMKKIYGGSNPCQKTIEELIESSGNLGSPLQYNGIEAVEYLLYSDGKDFENKSTLSEINQAYIDSENRKKALIHATKFVKDSVYGYADEYIEKFIDDLIYGNDDRLVGIKGKKEKILESFSQEIQRLRDNKVGRASGFVLKRSKNLNRFEARFSRTSVEAFRNAFEGLSEIWTGGFYNIVRLAHQVTADVGEQYRVGVLAYLDSIKKPHFKDWTEKERRNLSSLIDQWAMFTETSISGVLGVGTGLPANDGD